MERELLHLYPTLRMLKEALDEQGIACRLERDAGDRRFRGARRYNGQVDLSDEYVYVIDPNRAPGFRGSGLACACSELLSGNPAGLLLCPDRRPEDVLDALLACFDRCREMESRVDGLVYRNAEMAELCEVGAELLGNPLCVHDDWFVMIARSREFSEVMPPDYVMSSSREFIPRAVVEDFINDGEYLETYAHRTARLWEAGPGGPKCLYVNLWEDGVYRGRLLAAEYRRAFRPLDYALAELLGQRALALMSRKRPGQDRAYRGMDDIVYDLLNGVQPQAQEESRLLGLLGWERGDRMLCVRLEPQQQDTGVALEHALHSDLFQAFPRGYILYAGHQQCVLLSADREKLTLSMLRHRLAPLCRDYCLYAGLSSPVTGLRELNVAYEQARIALEKAFQLRSERWIMPFADCTLEYVLDQARGPMALRHLVAPELYRLIELDRENGTRYYETLRAYLLEERDIPRTSKALIVHRTTLLYRLRRLQACVPIDLDDPETRLRLLLSLWMLEHDSSAAT